MMAQLLKSWTLLIRNNIKHFFTKFFVTLTCFSAFLKLTMSYSLEVANDKMTNKKEAWISLILYWPTRRIRRTDIGARKQS